MPTPSLFSSFVKALPALLVRPPLLRLRGKQENGDELPLGARTEGQKDVWRVCSGGGGGGSGLAGTGHHRSPAGTVC